jgi:ankyrin repeat protein
LLQYRSPSGSVNVDAVNDDEETPLLEAARNNFSSGVSHLIDAKANVDVQDRFGNSALHHVTQHRNVGCMEQLLMANASPNLQNRMGRTPLHYAAENGDTAAARALVKFKADPNIRDETGDTPSLIAAEKNHTALLQAYLEGSIKPDFNLQNKQGFSPLYRACWVNNPTAVQMLLKGGASALVSDYGKGWSALHVAASRRCTKVLQLLLGSAEIQSSPAGAAHSNPVDLLSIAGMTPLFHTVTSEEYYQESEPTRCAQMLLAAGASITRGAESGWNPLHGAFSTHRLEFSKWKADKSGKPAFCC